jgi:hypothetical protein
MRLILYASNFISSLAKYISTCKMNSHQILLLLESEYYNDKIDQDFKTRS